MASINFIGGEKGGVGKSVTARVLAQYFIDKGVAFTGFDTDRSHHSFNRFYAEVKRLAALPKPERSQALQASGE